mmetsp:Transcript_71172/g.196536  ORF Transcript_71172/g.196536 Transcript_71172/m.196536 type:complete len:220 (+) Transcript_71172:72-731(+)
MKKRQPVRGGSCSCSHHSTKFIIAFMKSRESVRSSNLGSKATLFSSSLELFLAATIVPMSESVESLEVSTFVCIAWLREEANADLGVIEASDEGLGVIDWSPRTTSLGVVVVSDGTGLGVIHEDEAGISTRSFISHALGASGSISLGTTLVFGGVDPPCTAVWGTQQQDSVLSRDASSVRLMVRIELCNGSRASARSADTISTVRLDWPCGSMATIQGN